MTTGNVVSMGKIKHAGKILCKARKMRSISQSELARRMGRPPSFIAKGEQAASMTTWRFQDTLAVLGFEIRVVEIKRRAESEGAVEAEEETHAPGDDPKALVNVLAPEEPRGEPDDPVEEAAP
jgi:transcriptional regulator with XRE-family HTH domain